MSRSSDATEVLRYALAETTLGRALVAVSSTGVVAVLLGDEDELLERALAEEFSSARPERQGQVPWLSEVIAALEQPGRFASPPLDLRGTPFQLGVWDELMRITPSETITYAQLAQRLGSPNATRAVASACGANHIAVLVPCHRVVRADGGLGGYKWGLERKRTLLDREQQAD